MLGWIGQTLPSCSCLKIKVTITKIFWAWTVYCVSRASCLQKLFETILLKPIQNTLHFRLGEVTLDWVSLGWSDISKLFRSQDQGHYYYDILGVARLMCEQSELTSETF